MSDLKKEIAFVGNAGCILDEEKGAEIDEHMVVARINNFVLNDELKDNVGCKTNLWISSFYKDIKDREDDFENSVCPFPVLAPKWSDRYKINQTLFDKFKPECIPVDIFEKLIEIIPNPSTGMAAIWWTHMVGYTLPNLYGFSFFEGKHHYYDDHSRCSHNGIKERDLIEKIYNGDKA